MSLAWTYNPGADNGNVTGQTIARSSGLAATVTQAYTYVDPSNRLASANEGAAWSQTYGYDAFGNRAVTAGVWNQTGVLAGTTMPNPGNTPQSVSQFNGQNQWVRGAGDAYDGAGNQVSTAQYLNYGTVGSAFTYDGENRLLTTNIAQTGGPTFVYDGEGRRVQKISGSATTTYIHDAKGELVAEYSTAAPTPSGTDYLTADTLGSTRLITDATGNPTRCIDYLPFGEEIPTGVDGRSGCYGSLTSPQYPTTPDVAAQKFTGKERDAETGLDFFEARYFSSAQGRFSSPDPMGGSLTDPQSLNRYAYALNNPLRFTDPTGLYVCRDTADGACTSDQDKAFEKSLDKLRGADGDVGRAAAAYGVAGKDNGVTVGFADLGKSPEQGSTVSTLGADDNGKLLAHSDVTIGSTLSGVQFDATIGHEGSHVADAQDVVKSIASDPLGNFTIGSDITRYRSEQRAYGVTNSILSSESKTVTAPCGVGETCNLGFGVMQGKVPGIVDKIVGYKPNGYSSGGKPMSSKNQGGSVVSGLTASPAKTVPH